MAAGAARAQHAVKQSVVKDTLQGLGDIQPAVFLLAALLPVRGLGAFLPSLSDIPVNSLAMAALVVLGFTHHPQRQLKRTGLLIAAVVLVFWLVAVTIQASELTQLRRMGIIVLFFLFVWAVATGRLDLRSLSRGAMTGLVISTGISIALLPQSDYEGRLTGVLGDPNGAAAVIIAIGFAALQWSRARGPRLALLAVMAGGVVLTWSRTGIFAFLVAVGWSLLSPRLGRVVTALLAAATFYLYNWSETIMETNGWFVEREGSDDLRNRLAQATDALLESAPWHGYGLGSAQVEVSGTTMWFHNSYDAMQVEGGIIALVLLLIIISLLFLGLHQIPPVARPSWAEAAVVGALICAINIGYSLTQPAMAFAIGVYLAYWAKARDDVADSRRSA